MLVSAIVFSLAFVTILTAHAFEQFGGYPPCPLCLQERYAYYFAVPATLVAFFAARGNAIGFARIVLLLIAVGFLINAGVGVYHAGITNTIVLCWVLLAAAKIMDVLFEVDRVTAVTVACAQIGRAHV